MTMMQRAKNQRRNVFVAPHSNTSQLYGVNCAIARFSLPPRVVYSFQPRQSYGYMGHSQP